MKLLMRRFLLWNEWRKNCLNSSLHKFLVLIGLRYSPTFSEFKAIKGAMLEHPDWTIQYKEGKE